MLNFGASKPRVGGGARAPGAPPWIRTWQLCGLLYGTMQLHGLRCKSMQLDSPLHSYAAMLRIYAIMQLCSYMIMPPTLWAHRVYAAIHLT